MKKLALIGKSISHSLSPELFKVAYNSPVTNRVSNEYIYSLLDYSTLKEAMAVFLSQNYYGANITSPYKEEVFSYCTELDKTASESGAVNLILKQKNGLKGYNTDCKGVYTPLIIREIKPCDAEVVGAGGAARAAISTLKKAGYNITVVNRTLVKAQWLAEKYSTDWAPIDHLPQLFKSNKLLIYTISTYISSLEEANLKDVILLEANYKTPSLKNKSCKEYIPGTEWLVYQAIPSFKLFTGIEPNVHAMLKMANNH